MSSNTTEPTKPNSSENKVNIWLQSQSRLGLYDFNVNEKRVQEIHAKISALA